MSFHDHRKKNLFSKAFGEPNESMGHGLVGLSQSRLANAL